MNIGIIGAGKIGGMLARKLTKAGHMVSIANSRGPESLKYLEWETGAKAVTVEEAARAGEVVIVTIPMKNVAQLPRNLFDGAARSVVVVDTCNYYPRERDGRIEEIEKGMPESRYVEKEIGHPVIKAFNNMQAQHQVDLARPRGSKDRKALPVAGDDDAAKHVVMKLVDELGFDPVDAGGLDESWRQQPKTPVYTADLDAEGVKKELEQAEKERKPEFKAA
ncbi:MAG TPA: NAD(P)-binding domain-containing protein [Terracidiphilus sp.]|nr:NAD(P)-binding domain-containing protein [Terracidiphilus sp.]